MYEVIIYLMFSVLAYSLFILLGDMPDKVKKQSRKVRIAFRFGVMFLWPIYIPLFFIILMLGFVIYFFKSLFE